MKFTMHPNLSSKMLLTELTLCKVLLENNYHNPWLILVPKRPDVQKLMDLSREDQILLLEEIDMAQKVLWELFTPLQLNVASLCNKTPQLHIHIIARYEHDPAWPGVVWDHPTQTSCQDDLLQERANLIKNGFFNKILLLKKLQQASI